MSEAPNTSLFYRVGGALPQNVLSYVTRGSDRDLYESLKAGEFCYVLNSRQMGKTSLMVRTLAQLEAEGWAGSILDFSDKASQADQTSQTDQLNCHYWYNGIINKLSRQLKLLDSTVLRSWLKERDFIAPVERLEDFIATVLLPTIARPIVIFIDEIDSTLGLPFTDDFFALIRACYNKRAENPDYRRLTFALLGVAAPSELIGDANRTPFNIGESIDLKGFEFEEALPLAAGLAGKAEQPEEVLREILRWTGGQPFLTQRLCLLVVDSDAEILAGNEATQVQQLVESRLIENWTSQDYQAHFKTIKQRLLQNEYSVGRLLELYQKILRAGEVPTESDSIYIELRLSGLVVEDKGKLRVRNPIYARIFDNDWINHQLSGIRPYITNFNLWRDSDFKNNDYLLRGEDLKSALDWADGRALSQEDQKLLSKSIENERDEIIKKIKNGSSLLSKLENELADSKRKNEYFERNYRSKNEAVRIEHRILTEKIEQLKAQISKLSSEILEKERHLKELLNKLSPDGLKQLVKENENLENSKNQLLKEQHQKYHYFKDLELAKHYQEENKVENTRKLKSKKERIRFLTFFLPITILPFLLSSGLILLLGYSGNSGREEKIIGNNKITRQEILNSEDLPCGVQSLVSAFMIRSNDQYVNKVNIYESSNKNSEILREASNGELINLYFCIRDGYILTMQNDWIASDDVVNITLDNFQDSPNLRYFNTKGHIVFIKEIPRNGAGTPLIGFIDDGTFLVVENNDNKKWIKLQDGGYIESSLIDVQE